MKTIVGIKTIFDGIYPIFSEGGLEVHPKKEREPISQVGSLLPKFYFKFIKFYSGFTKLYLESIKFNYISRSILPKVQFGIEANGRSSASSFEMQSESNPRF